MLKYKTQKFPASRIATIDVCETGKRKHHVAGLIELDVTESREKIKHYNKGKSAKISFTAWLISVIGSTIKKYETASSYLSGKNKLMIFEDINISIVVEKDLDGEKVPVPLIIEKANEIPVESINKQIVDARNMKLSNKDIVLQRKAARLEKLYYLLPGFMRSYVWKYVLKHPKLAFKKMGNVAFTSLGTEGKVKGWFIPISVHPICFGISPITKKPAVVDNNIKIREILNMTILSDHDVIDGAPMARFISELSKNIETGINL
ncbi:MAG: 2-oxo acid dehydrogenase subunit E2 [Bacteroidales bacterium]|nr:2-oxo acid dehydrogenase subunit E2 [Bacteroidales bacterium]